jgi:ASC-1-like (ASCH) protein
VFFDELKMLYEISVRPPYLHTLGHAKTIEGRLNLCKFAHMRPGDILHACNVIKALYKLFD